MKGSIHRSTSGCRSIRQDWEAVSVETDTMTIRCRRAIVCAPAVVAREIRFDPPLPPRTEALFANTLMGSCLKFQALYDRPFWRSMGLNGTILSGDHTVSLTYDNSHGARSGEGGDRRIRSGRAGAPRQCSFVRRAGTRDPRVPPTVLRLIGEAARGAHCAGLEQGGVVPGSVCSALPAWDSHHGGIALWEACGRVHWAGTETSVEWTGYMEGAVRSADRVVQEVVGQSDWR